MAPSGWSCGDPDQFRVPSGKGAGRVVRRQNTSRKYGIEKKFAGQGFVLIYLKSSNVEENSSV